MARGPAIVMLIALGGCDGEVPPRAAEDAATVEAAPEAAPVCETRADCDDGVFCNGVEECLAGACVSARNAACRAAGGCADAVCDEARSACVFTARACDAGSTCSIDRGCVEESACAGDGDPRCDDGRACTDDVCVLGLCAHLPVDARCPAIGACGVGVCLGEEVADPSGCGSSPDSARCTAREGCVDGACVPLAPTCRDDRDCSDGTLCDGVERCVSGACVRGERTTCAAGPCEHATCAASGVGDPWCRVVTLARCP